MRTVIQVLRDNQSHGDRAVTFVRSGGTETAVSYPELWAQSALRAQALLALGLTKGDRVALVLPEPDDFVMTFLATLTAGLVAVPVYPPQTLGKVESYAETLTHILEAADANVLVVADSVVPLVSGKLAPSLRIISPASLAVPPTAAPPLPEVLLSDLAFLQFTSGSTSKPKGVMVTHENLAANAHAIMFDGLKSTPADRGVSWLPLYHDMGLIGFVVAPLYALVQIMFLPTMSFVRRPSVWLDAVNRYRATITFAPNFAFALASRAATPAQLANWDLSCLRVVGCGAEPIQAGVLREFIDTFSAAGLKPESLLPSYGMAEATLAVTFHDVTRPIVTDRVDAAALRSGKALPGQDAALCTDFVSCGVPFPHHELSIVRENQPAGDREVGEIWVRGPSVTKGYFGNPEATQDAFADGWLKTGDLGYRAGGNLFICGREKDLIILSGKNHYPQDIEQVVTTVDGIRENSAAAFATLSSAGAEQAVVVAESRKAGESLPAMKTEVISRVRAELGVTLSDVVFIKRGTLPRTSSGKVQRRETKRRYLEGLLDVARTSYRPGPSIPPGASLPPSEAMPVFPTSPNQGAPHGIHQD